MIPFFSLLPLARQQCILFFVLLLILINMRIQGQTIDSCTSKKIVYQSVANKFFSKRNIDLTHYDWSNNTVNCHIGSAIRKHNLNIGFTVSGTVCATFGLFIGTIGLVLAKDDDASNSEVASWITTGAVLTAGGITFLIAGGADEKKSRYHMSQVNAYFRNK